MSKELLTKLTAERQELIRKLDVINNTIQVFSSSTPPANTSTQPSPAKKTYQKKTVRNRWSSIKPRRDKALQWFLETNGRASTKTVYGILRGAGFKTSVQAVYLMLRKMPELDRDPNYGLWCLKTAVAEAEKVSA